MPATTQPPLRKEGRAKVTGAARYVADMRLPGMLHGATVRSPVARGTLRGIHYDPAIPWHEFTIVTAADIPGENCVFLIKDDQPYLATGAINHAEEPVVLLAHPDAEMLERGRRGVTLDIEPLPGVFTMDDAIAADQVLARIEMERGDVDAAWADAAYIVEGAYETGAQEQLYIEPNGMVAQTDAESVTVWGSMQCPYYVHKALVRLFGLPAERVRVVQMETGGGFGGKEDYPSIIAGHAALLARKSGRPVRILYDRFEDMAATTKRHPSRTRHRTAVAADGRLLAADIEFLIDGGAYTTLSPVVLSRGVIHSCGPYRWPNVRVRAKALATNHPPRGAFRGFGAPQSLFAMERHMNKIAARLRISPEELRRRNFLHCGDATATGQIIREDIDLDGLLDRALRLSDYRQKLSKFADENRGSHIKRGIGFATFLHGAGFTGAGEDHMKSIVGIEGTTEGKARILAASAEIGQGAHTVLAQIAAETLGIPYDQVEMATPDTAEVPNSGPTVASRTAMVVGKLVESAALSLRRMLTEAGFDAADFTTACRRYHERFGRLVAYTQYTAPPGIQWNDATHTGDAYGTYAWAVYVAEVSIDTLTYETKVNDFVALQEIGRVIHPVIAEGQIQGGVAQGIGFALYEEVIEKQGRMENAQMTNYIMPTSADLPPIRVYFEEKPYAHGPGGAKGLGELPIDGPAPAIANAIEQALGVPLDRVPVTPERIMEALARG